MWFTFIDKVTSKAFKATKQKWSNEVYHRVIKPSSVVVDRPYACWDVARVNPISTHTDIYMFTLQWAHVHKIPSLFLPAVVIYTVVICFCLHKLLRCVSWSGSHPGVKVLTTSSALLFFCVKDKIQGDLGVGEVGWKNLLGLAACSGGGGFGMICPSSRIQPPPA